jgi:hypothetical protein
MIQKPSVTAKHYELNSEDHVSVLLEEPRVMLKRLDILVIEISKTTRCRFLSVMEVTRPGKGACTTPRSRDY